MSEQNAPEPSALDEAMAFLAQNQQEIRKQRVADGEIPASEADEIDVTLSTDVDPGDLVKTEVDRIRRENAASEAPSETSFAPLHGLVPTGEESDEEVRNRRNDWFVEGGVLDVLCDALAVFRDSIESEGISITLLDAPEDFKLALSVFQDVANSLAGESIADEDGGYEGEEEIQ